MSSVLTFVMVLFICDIYRHIWAHSHRDTHTHLCKPKEQPGMVNGDKGKPFYWCVVLFEILSSVYCNQSAFDYSTPP